MINGEPIPNASGSKPKSFEEIEQTDSFVAPNKGIDPKRAAARVANDAKGAGTIDVEGVKTFEEIEQTDNLKSASTVAKEEAENLKQKKEYFDNAKKVYEAGQKGNKTFEEIENTDDLGGKIQRAGWREKDPGTKYDEWIKGAGPHSKLGKTYRGLQAKVREANKTQFSPRALKDIASTPLPTTKTNK